MGAIKTDGPIDSRMRRRRFNAAQIALYELVDLLRRDGHHGFAQSLERHVADQLGEYVPDAYAGRRWPL